MKIKVFILIVIFVLMFLFVQNSKANGFRLSLQGCSGDCRGMSLGVFYDSVAKRDCYMAVWSVTTSGRAVDIECFDNK